MKHAQLKMTAEVTGVLTKGKGDFEEELEEEWELWLTSVQICVSELGTAASVLSVLSRCRK